MRLQSAVAILPFFSLLAAPVLAQETVDEMEVVDTEAWEDSSKFKDEVLDAHNRAREERNATSLTWDDDLAKSAKKWADKCKWEHSGDEHGENLATNYASPNASVEAWVVEEEDYDPKNPKFSKKTGHFTQVVWKDTEKVGCAAKDCGDADKDIEEGGPARGWFLVCQYTPQGNVKGQFEDNVEKVGESGVAGLGVGWGKMGLMLAGVAAIGIFGL